MFQGKQLRCSCGMGEEILQSPLLARIKADRLERRIEMNVIIIAACIPTLRPIFIVFFKRPGADNFRASVRERGHSSYYYRTADSEGSKRTATESNPASDVSNRASGPVTGNSDAISSKDAIDGGCVIQVASIEMGSRGGEVEEGEWGHVSGSGVPMTNIGSDQDTEGGESERLGDKIWRG